MAPSGSTTPRSTLYPAGEEQCGNPFCRRVMFIYGEVYDHDQLNDATHAHLHEAFGVANMTTFKQITLALREGHIVSADGADVYLPATDRFKLPISFLHGENNRLFTPEGSQAHLRLPARGQRRPTSTRARHQGYAHMDCSSARTPPRDVYPVVTAELDRHN